MAPLRIRCVVSFSSQDPKYPADNLLLEETVQPWLCCPLDRSRQLKAELQLEQASCIGYIDVGNCGSAFLQIDVGRSSWPPDQSYLTLLPTTPLMMPADAKLNKNRSGVRMFKEGDLLASALAEKWDRVRLTCSQPFNRHAQFGLSFIRIRTPREAEDSQADPAASSPCQASPESKAKPWLSSPVFGRTFFPAGPSSSAEEEALLRSQLQRLEDPASHRRGLSPACLSRPARLVLEAAASVHRRALLPPTGSPPPAASSKEAGRARSAAGRPGAPGPKQEQSVGSGHVKAKRRQGSSRSSMGRPRNSSRRKGGAPSQRRKPRTGEDGEEEEEEEEEGGPREGDAVLGTCPICAGCFPAKILPVHASGCGEEADTARAPSSPLWEAWVGCPICQVRFPASEVEGHASSCGEDA